MDNEEFPPYDVVSERANALATLLAGKQDALTTIGYGREVDSGILAQYNRAIELVTLAITPIREEEVANINEVVMN